MTKETIYQQMLEEFETRTGSAMTEQADLAVRLYAAAAQIASLYAYGDWVCRQAFPQTAMGVQLDYHGAMRGLTRQAAATAEGSLRFSVRVPRSMDLQIEAGTVCMTAGMVRFVTTQAAVLEAGELFVDVPARAEAPGAEGNVGSGTVTRMALAPVGVTDCTNPDAFTGGLDAEDDDRFRARILDSFVHLDNGGNAAFYENRVRQNDGVAAVKILPRHQGVGTVGVVVTAPGGPADQELVSRIQADLDQAREMAVTVTVMAPDTVEVDIAAAVRVAAGYDSQAVLGRVEDALQTWFDGTRLAEPVYRARLGSLIYAVEGVENYTLTSPGQDVPISDTQLPVLGTLSITEANDGVS